MSFDPAERLVDLELKDVAEKVPDVGNVVGNVKFGAGIEIRLAAPNRRPNALDAAPGCHMRGTRGTKTRKERRTRGNR